MPDAVWDRDSRLGCASRVAMMQSADHRQGDDLPSIDGLALARFRGVLVEREVSPASVVVLDVLPHDAPQVVLSKDDSVVQAFPPKGPDDALAAGILPRGPGRGDNLLDSHRTHAANEAAP